MTDVVGERTMNEQFEGEGKEYFATPIRMPDIVVVGPRLLVKPPKMGDLTLASGIVIPERARERVDRGLVLVVGNGLVPEGSTWDEEAKTWLTAAGKPIVSRFKKGMEVLYAKYAGAELSLYGDDYVIINEADVRCILEEYRLNDGSGATGS